MKLTSIGHARYLPFVADRYWLLAGARIGESIARKLTLNLSIERLVWSG
jgi:hypothetical protein